MARPRSEFLGTLGKLFAIFKMVVDKVLEKSINADEDIAKIGNDDKLATQIAQVITGNLVFVRAEIRGDWVYWIVDAGSPEVSSLWRDPFWPGPGRHFVHFAIAVVRSSEGAHAGTAWKLGMQVTDMGDLRRGVGYITRILPPQDDNNEPVIHVVFPRTRNALSEEGLNPSRLARRHEEDTV